jgi:hypothetical protein
MSEFKEIDMNRKFRRYMIEKHDKATLDEVMAAPYSSIDAAKEADKAVKTLADSLGKTSQKLIKGMLDGVKSKKYSPLDLMKSLNAGLSTRAHGYELDFLQGLWKRAEDRFRRYMPKGKMTF